MARVSGCKGLDDLIKGYQAQIPGYSVAIMSGIDSHNEFARFTWEIRHADDALIVDGTDYATFGADGRITRLVGFSGPLLPPRS